jgi:hypothetical protein
MMVSPDQGRYLSMKAERAGSEERGDRDLLGERTQARPRSVASRPDPRAEPIRYLRRRSSVALFV